MVASFSEVMLIITQAFDDLSERIQKSGAVCKECRITHGNIGHQPDDESRRCRHYDGTAQDEQGSVKDRADDTFSDLRLPVWRQLQREGRWNAF